MRAKIVILPNGQISTFIEEGSFEEGKQALAQLLAELEAEGMDFASVNEVEQHRHAEVREEVRHHVHN